MKEHRKKNLKETGTNKEGEGLCQVIAMERRKIRPAVPLPQKLQKFWEVRVWAWEIQASISPTPSVHGEGLVCKESSAKEPIELTPTLQSPI